MFQYQQPMINPVLDKIKELFIYNINQMISSNTISHEMGSKVYQVGEPYFQEIMNTLKMRYSSQNVPVDEINNITIELISNIINSSNQQSYSPQINSAPLAQMNTQNVPLFNNTSNFQPQSPVSQNTSFDFGVEKEQSQENVVAMEYTREDMENFQIYLKNHKSENKGGVKNFFRSTVNNKDFRVSKANVVKTQDILIASELIGILERPFFYHTEVLKTVLNSEKSFFKTQEDRSINLLCLNTKQYKHFHGNCENAIKIILKCKAKYGSDGYSHDFINMIKDNNHRFVKIVEQIVIERINKLLEFYFRTKNAQKLRYSISSLDDIEDLTSLDLNVKNDITEHNRFQNTIDMIVRASFDWLFNSKIDVNEALVDVTKEENLPQLLSTGLLKISDHKFMEYDYFTLDDEMKNSYMDIVNNNLLFKIPQLKIITGYEDKTFLSRFQSDDYVIIDDFRSPFEAYLNHILINVKKITPTLLHIKTEDGFISINVGIGLDKELVCKKL